MRKVQQTVYTSDDGKDVLVEAIANGRWQIVRDFCTIPQLEQLAEVIGDILNDHYAAQKEAVAVFPDRSSEQVEPETSDLIA